MKDQPQLGNRTSQEFKTAAVTLHRKYKIT